MFIVKFKKIFLGVAVLYSIVAVVILSVFGLRLGIDFTGGTITEISFESRPQVEVARGQLDSLNLGSYTLQPIGENNFLIRTRFLEDSEREAFNQSIAENLGAKIERSNSIGPTISRELTSKALIGIAVVSLITILFIAFAFRGVSDKNDSKDHGISSFKYGIVAIITLLHDILIPAAIFSLLGKFYNIEIDILFIMALLSILGLSINDTIVVFDRIRENLKFNKEKRNTESFEDTVGKSLSQTFVRSFNTSLTVLLVLFSLFLFGSESTKYFILALMVGMAAGVYSSLFIASPLLVLWGERKGK